MGLAWVTTPWPEASMITTNRLVLLKYTSCHSNTQIKLDLPAEVCIKLSVFYLFHSLMMSCFPLKEDYEKYMRQKLPAEFFFFFFSHRWVPVVHFSVNTHWHCCNICNSHCAGIGRIEQLYPAFIQEWQLVAFYMSFCRKCYILVFLMGALIHCW